MNIEGKAAKIGERKKNIKIASYLPISRKQSL